MTLTDHKFFNSEEFFSSSSNTKYSFLPFNFNRTKDNDFIISNICGESIILNESDFNKFILKKLSKTTFEYKNLKSKNFLYENDPNLSIRLLSMKYRTKMSTLADFTGLHIFVTTLRCDYSCSYCQVSRQTEDKESYDMTEEQAEAALKLVFGSPNQNIKIEFQGGEPLLNFEIIKFVVNKGNEINKIYEKNLQYVIASNLSFINDEVIDFCAKHNIYLSTSIDGPADLHNKNRPRPNKNGYEITTKNLLKIQKRLGNDRVSALLTTTSGALDRVNEIIDTYLNLGINDIFLRPLSPYGFAIKTKSFSKYQVSEWFEFYKKGLDYILDLNEKGVQVRESYASLITRKLLSPYATKYVDLQSPAGIGISVIVYNYDGKIYASDEARMLKEMGNEEYCLGSVFDNYEDIFTSDKLINFLDISESHSAPMCRDCAFLEHCGAEPVYHSATQNDPLGIKSLSGFCSKNMSLFEHILKILNSNSNRAKILKSWAKY